MEKKKITDAFIDKTCAKASKILETLIPRIFLINY